MSAVPHPGLDSAIPSWTCRSPPPPGRCEPSPARSWSRASRSAATANSHLNVQMPAAITRRRESLRSQPDRRGVGPGAGTAHSRLRRARLRPACPGQLDILPLGRPLHRRRGIRPERRALPAVRRQPELAPAPCGAARLRSGGALRGRGAGRTAGCAWPKCGRVSQVR